MHTHQAVIGTQWGDEGKGKVVDYLAAQHDVIIRYQGGPNAGHTVVLGKKKFPLHLLPSGILYPAKTCVIGDGVIVNPVTLVSELERIVDQTKHRARLLLSLRAQVIMPWHEIRDGIAGGVVGTTKKGIGPTYTDAVSREGIRVYEVLDKKGFQKKLIQQLKWNTLLIQALVKYHELTQTEIKKLKLKSQLDPKIIVETYFQAFKRLETLGVEFCDTSAVLNQVTKKNQTCLFEGAQATLLDITYGDYPFVTSSHPTIGGIYIGTGIRPVNLEAIGVVKAYATRVGNGPFATELDNGIGEKLRQAGQEFGTTTGRPRRCGWLDLVIINYAKRINGLNALAITKLDILSGFETIRVAVAYQIDSEITQEYPISLTQKQEAVPLYRELEGWTEDISQAKKYSELPKAAQTYIEFIESQTGLPVTLIGVGPERNQLIVK